MLRVGSSCAIAIFCAAVGLLTTACSSALVSPSRDDMERAQQDVLNIERQQSVAIGLSVRNEEGQVLLEWRSRERFPLTSTVKALECARVYELGLQEQKAPIGTAKPVPHSPVLGNLPSNALITLGQACRAALSTSDNRAANFIFQQTGGPAALTNWLRQLGDNTTRSDRLEPQLNLSGKTEYRDTTTPSNASLNWQRIDHKLSKQARSLWLNDLASSQVSSHLLKPLVPEHWIVYDRTGAGSDAYSATRAIHAIIVTDRGARYYLALHLRAEAGTDLIDRDEICVDVLQIVLSYLKSLP